jgi:two-component sensor histidine kinase
MDQASGQTKDAAAFGRALVGASRLPMLLFDGSAEVLGASRSFCAAFNIPIDETDGRTLAQLGAGEWDVPQLRLLLENALLGGPEMGDYETDLIRRGQPPRRLSINVQNVVYADATHPRVLMAVNDITDVRQAERLNISLLLEKDSLLREKAILLEELQHRVANSLQIIASVLLLKARAVKSEETRIHLHETHARVMSLTAVQNHLSFSIGDVEVRLYLAKLCDSLSASMMRSAATITLSVKADEARLSSQEAVSLGLIVTELVINALKHAFPDGRGGEITVAYRVTASGWVLSVSDTGVGRSHNPGASARSGLGTSIVEGLAKQLGAVVAISDDLPGTSVAIINGGHAVSRAAPGF